MSYEKRPDGSPSFDNSNDHHLSPPSPTTQPIHHDLNSNNYENPFPNNKTDVTDDTTSLYQRPLGFTAFYRHPISQVVMLGFICFLCPGLFNALNGLGAAGGLDSATSANANAAVYSTFAAMAFFAGSVNNKLGSRKTLLIGTAGYSIYMGSYLASNIHPKAGPFVIAAGALVGICGGLLWTAQGSLMLAYPTETTKGLYIGIFWSTFNLGGVVGSSMALGENIHSKANAVGNATYIGFLVLTLVGVTIPLLMTDPEKMYRTDGSKVTTPRHPSWKTEIYSLIVAFKTDPAIVLLFPMFFASNYFYTWQFNDYNGAIFNIRTRGLNNLCYWLSQIFGSLSIGLLLDARNLTRRTRAFVGWIVLMIMVTVVHVWAFEYQKTYTRATEDRPDNVKIDYSDKDYQGKLWLYIFCGLVDSMWQTTAYWFMGAMSNDPAKLAIFTGFYKSIQSAGGAGAWRADAVKLPYMNLFLSTWILLVAGLIFALPMLYNRVKNQTDLEDEVIARMNDQGQILSVAEVEIARAHQDVHMHQY